MKQYKSTQSSTVIDHRGQALGTGPRSDKPSSFERTSQAGCRTKLSFVGVIKQTVNESKSKLACKCVYWWNCDKPVRSGKSEYEQRKWKGETSVALTLPVDATIPV